LGLCRVFWQMRVIAVFPLKTGGSIPKTHSTLFYTIPIGISGFGGFL
jgi:hypothetical protein